MLLERYIRGNKKDRMIISDFLNDKGRVSSTRTTKSYVKKHFYKEYSKVIKHSEMIGLEPERFSEELYHYLNNILEPVKCKKCTEKIPKFTGLLTGYLDYCSSKCSNSSLVVMEKKERTYIKKYGVDNPSKSNIIKKKIENKFIENYGGNPFTVKKIKDQIKKTNLIKYGNKHPMGKGSNLYEKLDNEKLDTFLNKYRHLEVIKRESKKWGEVTIKCNECNNNFTISKWNLHQRTKLLIETNPCTICNPIGCIKSSGIEDFVRAILEKNKIRYTENDRTILEGKEIDFLLPDHNIGIETNGLYWHSERFKHPLYHQEKTNLAKNKGYLLIHIFEDEITKNKELVKSRILSILNQNKRIIYARKCSIKEIDSKKCNAFLIENHLQGAAGAKKRYGMFYGGELVSVMTFGSLRKNMGNIKKEGHWELIRFCNLRGISVIGGASKLLSKFKKNNTPKKLVTYCDARWSDGEFYRKLGFILEHQSKPNYWYFKNGIRENRFKYRKDQLIKEGYDPKKSEARIMNELGFLKIYDSGSYKFSM